MEDEHIRSGFLKDVISESSNDFIEVPQENNIDFINDVNENNNRENIKIKFKIKKIICQECNNFPKIYLNDDRYTIK